MTDLSKAWIWEHYQGVIVDGADEAAAPAEARVVRFQAIQGSKEDSMDQRSNDARVKFGTAIAIAIAAGAFFPMIALLLFLVAALLIASGKEPSKTAEFLGNLPGGEHITKALNQVDRWLS